MLDLWAGCRNPATGGLRHLPQGGGYGDQPAALIDAFGIIEVKRAEVVK